MKPPKSIGCRDGTQRPNKNAKDAKGKEEEEKQAARKKMVEERKAKKKERRRVVREARAVPTDEPKVDEAKAADKPGEAAEKDEMDVEKKEGLKVLVMPKAPCLKEFMSGRSKPPDVVTVKSAEQCLLEVAPKDRAEELARARADVAFLEKSLEEANKGATGSLQKAAAEGFEKQLKGARDIAAQLAEKAPVSAVTVTLLKKTVSNHEHTSTQRVQAWKASAEKRATNKDAALKQVDDHILELQKYRQSVVDDCAARQTAWEEHNQKMELVISKVAAVLQERLNAAIAEMGDKNGAVDAEVVAAAAEVAQTPAQPAAPAAQPAPTQQETDYYATVPWTAEELPCELPEAKEGEHLFWIRLAYNVQEWTHTHGCQPCTYNELMADGTGTVAAPEVLSRQMESLAGLIGMPYWIKLYGERKVRSTDVVPHHLGFVLFQALMKPRQVAEQALGSKKAAEELKVAKAAIKASLGAKHRPKIGRFVKNASAK
jgi:hypothetical protein